MKVCAIHQPNFFPWTGYFDKIERADIFVFLDQVDYPKSGSSMSSWCNRVKINFNGNANWISCPLIREHGPQLINSVKISYSRDWKKELERALYQSYRNSCNFEEVNNLIMTLLKFESNLLADFNINSIKTIAEYIGLNTHFIKQSELPQLDSTSTMRLIEISKQIGADAYLYGGGASNYQDNDAFLEAGIKLISQDYVTKPYGDIEEFIPGLSIIDWLMNRPNI